MITALWAGQGAGEAVIPVDSHGRGVPTRTNDTLWKYHHASTRSPPAALGGTAPPPKETPRMSGSSQEKTGEQEGPSKDAEGWRVGCKQLRLPRPGLEFTRRSWDFTPSTRGRDRRILSKIATWSSLWLGMMKWGHFLVPASCTSTNLISFNSGFCLESSLLLVPNSSTLASSLGIISWLQSCLDCFPASPWPFSSRQAVIFLQMNWTTFFSRLKAPSGFPLHLESIITGVCRPSELCPISHHCCPRDPAALPTFSFY